MPETNFFWDPLSDNILQERDETGAVPAEYTTEPELYGNLISQSRQGVESQYHFDALGSTLALTDDSQQVTDTYAYSAFGVVTEQIGNTSNPFQYGGEKGIWWDSETQSVFARRVPYRPAVGRTMTSWKSTDGTVEYSGNGLFLKWLLMAIAQVGPDEADVPRCTDEESACIRDAVKLVKDTIAVKRELCFGDLRRCPDGERSLCTPDALGDCLLSVLERTVYFCANRGVGGCHPVLDLRDRNEAHTDSLCAWIKGAGARGVRLPRILECDPCKFPLPYANDCMACPDPILFLTATYLCRDLSPDRRSIASYCNSRNPDDLRRLAVILVHEAAHSCVGGHDTTGKKRADDPPSCDKCHRNDSFDIDAGFTKCVT